MKCWCNWCKAAGNCASWGHLFLQKKNWFCLAKLYWIKCFPEAQRVWGVVKETCHIMLLISALEFEAAPKYIAIKSHCRPGELSVGGFGSLISEQILQLSQSGCPSVLSCTRGNYSAEHPSFCDKRLSVSLTKDSSLGSCTWNQTFLPVAPKSLEWTRQDSTSMSLESFCVWRQAWIYLPSTFIWLLISTNDCWAQSARTVQGTKPLLLGRRSEHPTAVSCTPSPACSCLQSHGVPGHPWVWKVTTTLRTGKSFSKGKWGRSNLIKMDLSEEMVTLWQGIGCSLGDRIRVDLPSASWGLEANEWNCSAHLFEQVLAAAEVLRRKAGSVPLLWGKLHPDPWRSSSSSSLGFNSQTERAPAAPVIPSLSFNCFQSLALAQEKSVDKDGDKTALQNPTFFLFPRERVCFLIW